MTGKVFINFNQPLIHGNVTNETLLLTVYNSEFQDKHMNFTWNVKLFREQELEIQVLFGDPLGISVSSVRYQKFLKGLGM